MNDLTEKIEYITKRIIDLVHPQKILLFGSASRNEMSKDSDIDLLVIMGKGIQRRKTAQQLYRDIKGAGIPFDILVATEEDLQKHKDNLGLIYRTALLEGKVVYASN
jgi:predicted nucleotidyltransferase